MKEFKVNDYISLKLENDKSNIYINGALFIQCKLLLFDIPVNEIKAYNEIKSIDEALKNLDETLQPTKGQISPETEFWGHCSNLQVWAENNYNTKLLHSNIAFPLLKKLVEEGDAKARKVFKKEIAKRIESGCASVITYLINEDYVNYLPEEYVKELFNDEMILEKLYRALNRKPFFEKCLEVHKKDANNGRAELRWKKETELRDIIGVYYYYDHDNFIDENHLDLYEENLLEGRVIDLCIWKILRGKLDYRIGTINSNIIKELFEIFEKYPRAYDPYENSLLNKELIASLILNILKENSPVKSEFLEEFNTRISNYNDEDCVEIDMIECFLTFCDKKKLKLLINSKKSNFLELLFKIKRKIWNRKEGDFDLSFWNGNEFLESVGDSLSTPVKNKVIRIIEQDDLNELMFVIGSKLLDTLTKEDLTFLIKNPKTLLFENIIKTVKQNFEILNYSGDRNVFSDRINECACDLIKIKIINIVKRNDVSSFITIVALGLIQKYFETSELISLFTNPNSNFIECLIRACEYDFERRDNVLSEYGDYYIKLFDKNINIILEILQKNANLSVKNKIEIILKNKKKRYEITELWKEIGKSIESNEKNKDQFKKSFPDLFMWINSTIPLNERTNYVNYEKVTKNKWGDEGLTSFSRFSMHSHLNDYDVRVIKYEEIDGGSLFFGTRDGYYEEEMWKSIVNQIKCIEGKNKVNSVIKLTDCLLALYRQGNYSRCR